MPDPLLMLRAAAAAGLASAVVMLMIGLLARARRRSLPSWSGVLGSVVGVLVGCVVLDVHPRWPPREDQDRLLWLLLPAVAMVELIGLSLQRPRWLAWSLRLMVAAIAAPVLLYGTVYLTDVAGPGTREWSVPRTWLILGALAGTLACVWTLLSLLARPISQTAADRPDWRGVSVLIALAVTCVGAGVCVMLSGYASGGQLGFPIGGAIAGPALAALIPKSRADLRGVLGFGVVGLFALLVVGHFFGEMTTTNAALLFLAPLLGWLPELPGLRRIGPRTLAPARVLLTTLLIALVLFFAQQKFADNSARTAAPEAGEPTVDDYLNFGK